MIKEKKDRYPGLKAFEKDDTNIFFGRDNDVDDFMNIISAEKTIVLFGASGTGKSSLLNTKITNRFEEMSFFPIRIRFTSIINDDNAAGENKIISPPPHLDPQNYLLKEVKDIGKDKLTALEFSEGEIRKILNGYDIKIQRSDILYNEDKPKLWEIVKAAGLAVRSKTYPDVKGVVLIFDQFEEFFYYSQEEQDKFNSQLAEIVDDWPPKRLLDWINSFAEEKLTDELLNWYAQPNLKIIFSIRSDKLSQISSMVSYVPKILRTRYELKSFKISNAIEAIENPAVMGNENDEFNSPPIAFSEGVKSKIINALKNEFDEIECSFLQIVCYYVEQKVKNSTNDLKTVFRFDESMMDANVNVENILDDFYFEQTDKLSPEYRHLVRDVIEEDLVVDGQRASLLASQFVNKLNKKEDLIKYLLGARLIREENTPRGMTYELSHDKLINAVEKSKNIRRAKMQVEEEAKNERERLEREAKDEKERLEKEALIKEERLKEQRVQLKKQKKLKEEAIEARKQAEQLTRFATRAKNEADKARDEANKARDEANNARVQSRRLSLAVALLGIVLTTISIIFLISIRNQKKKNNAYLSKILVSRGIDELDRNKNSESFNYLLVAEELNNGDSRIDSMFTVLSNNIFSGISINFIKRADILSIVLPDSSLQVWNISKDKFSMIQKFDSVKDYMICERGNVIAVGYKNKKVALWDLVQDKMIDSSNDYFQSRFSTLNTKLLISNNGSHIARFDSSGYLKIYRIEKGHLLAYKNENLALIDSANRKINSFDNFPEVKDNIVQVNKSTFDNRNIRSVMCFSSDGTSLVICNSNKGNDAYTYYYNPDRSDNIPSNDYDLFYFLTNDEKYTPRRLANVSPVFDCAFNDLKPENSDSIFYKKTTDESFHVFNLKNNEDSVSNIIGRFYPKKMQNHLPRLCIVDSVKVVIVQNKNTLKQVEGDIYDFNTGLLIENFVSATSFSGEMNSISFHRKGFIYIDSSNYLMFQDYHRDSAAKKLDSATNRSTFRQLKENYAFSEDGNFLCYPKADSLVIKNVNTNSVIKKIAVGGTILASFIKNNYILLTDKNSRVNRYLTRLIPVNTIEKEDLLKIYPDKTPDIKKEYKIDKL